jgi:hypothetical protein
MPKVRRFSGNLKIELAYNDRSDQYRVRLCPIRDGGCETVLVRAPASKTTAVDSPSAYDRAAHAAISFASERIQEHAEPGRPGRIQATWHIQRPRRRR